MTVGELRAALAAAEVLREYDEPAPKPAITRPAPPLEFQRSTFTPPAPQPDDPRAASGAPDPMER